MSNIIHTEYREANLQTASLFTELIQQVDFAFQPIVHFRTGKLFGVEALLRNFQSPEINSINDFFNTAYTNKNLYAVDLALREKAIKKFCQLPNFNKLKLFYNLDNRLLDMPDYKPGNTIEILNKYQLPQLSFVFEISEKHQFQSFGDAQSILSLYQKQGFKIAIDDYGAGYSGMQLLYYSKPDILKVDRFFIKNVADNNRKKLLLTNIVELAHIMGTVVVAEGIETEAEFQTCLEVGCDLAQGYFIEMPIIEIEKIRSCYTKIQKISNRNLQQTNSDDFSKDIEALLISIKPIHIDTEMGKVFDHLKNQKIYNFFPIINQNEEPIGIIAEQKIKEYIYSPYGRDLLVNKKLKDSLKDFLIPCVTVEFNQSIDSIIKVFSSFEKIEMIIVTKLGKYLGCLSIQAIVKIINRKKLLVARDQNPLTHLPGNRVIESFVETMFHDKVNEYAIIYIDINDFKPFNDFYGFSDGDRVIIYLSRILRTLQSKIQCFIGHIGGDDFFIGLKNSSCETAISIAEEIQENFNEDRALVFPAFTSAEQHFESFDRKGVKQKYSALSLSCATIYFPKFKRPETNSHLSNIIAQAKIHSKAEKKKLYSVVYEENKGYRIKLARTNNTSAKNRKNW